ncbi:MAG: hypothetical protein RBU30_00910 [Polyangia bacterium]|jgi:electron transfer flavoprotein alpha/beta subunit|nr:hypothetical protein [Polyangia bacterium]
MKIVVLLRSSPVSNTPAPQASRLGCHEAAALVQGIRLRDSFPGATLTALCVGEESEDSGLLDALALGADRAHRLWDPLLGKVDSLGVARALAAATEHLGFDLVLGGARSPDESLGFVGPALAESLSISHLADADELRWAEGQTAVVAQRCAATRRFSHLLQIPCLITLQSTAEAAIQVSAPRRKDLVPGSLSLADVGLDEAVLRPRCRLSGELRPFSAPPYVTAWAEDSAAVVEHLRDLDLL